MHAKQQQLWGATTMFVLLVAAAEAASAVTLHGRVVDSAGDPIANAELRYIGARHILMLPYDSNGSVVSTSDAEGQFELQFAEDDYRFLANSRAEGTLVCSHPHHQLTFQTVPVTRFLVDAPMTIELSAQLQPTKVQIVDQTGTAVEGIEVRPAVLMSTTFPFLETESFSRITDNTGVVEFPGIAATLIKKVYISGDAVGNQCLQLELPQSATTAASLVATVMPSKVLSGQVRIATEDRSGRPDLTQITLLLLSRESANEEQFSWDEVTLTAVGRIENARLFDGPVRLRARFAADMPFLFDSLETYNDVRTPEGTLEAKLYSATLVVGQVIDSSTGDGIPHLYVNQHGPDNRQAFTNLDGRFQFWVGAKPTSYFTADPFGRFVALRSAASRIEKLPIDGVIRLDPTRLYPAAKAVGKILNADGKPVAGADVNIEFQMDRHTGSTVAQTDRQGEFRFFHIPEGSHVKLTARRLGERTASPLELTVDAEAAPVLQLQPVKLRRFSGRLIAENGRPVSGASITLQRAQIVTPEQYQGEDRLTLNLFDDAVLIVTDDNGRFESPPTDEAMQDISVKVIAAGYDLYHSHWMDIGEVEEAASNNIDVGEFRLRRLNDSRAVSVRVVDDATGEIIPEARIVFRGARSGMVKMLGSVDTGSGPAELVMNVSDGQQVVAASTTGYQPAFEVLRSLPDSVTLRLKKIATPRDARPRSPATSEQLRSLASRLLRQIPEPSQDDNLFHKLYYYNSFAYADPAGFIALAPKLMETSSEIMRVLGSGPLGFPIEQRRQLVDVVEGQPKVELLLGICKDTSDEAERSELFDTAIKLIQDFPGEDGQTLVSRIACAMLETGRSEQAIDLLRQSYRDDPSLLQLLESGERIEKGGTRRGTARYFLPEYALVDRRASMKLIEQCAYANEIEYLKSQAVVFMASQDMLGWELAAKAYLKDGAIRSGVTGFMRKLNFKNLSSGKRLAAMLDDPITRASLLLNIAEHAEEVKAEERVELAEQALTSLRSAQKMPGSTHASAVHAEACVLVSDWSPELAEHFAFESLWTSERDAFTRQPYSTLSGVAKLLAQFDRQLAKALIEPCFDDWSWLFDSLDAAFVYQQIAPLEAAALIDPEWAEQVVNALCQNQLAGRNSRQLSVIGGLVQACSAIQLD